MSWEQLRSIAETNAAARAYWESQPPRACPNDGTPLVKAPPGAGAVELYCPHDGYRFPEGSDW